MLAKTLLCVAVGAIIATALISNVVNAPAPRAGETPVPREWVEQAKREQTKKMVGDITFSQRVRGCFPTSGCEQFVPGEEYIIWEMKNSPPGTWGYSVCITTQFLVADPEECAWVTPTSQQVSRFHSLSTLK